MSELRRLRRARGLSQEALAEKSGVSAFTITELERGKRQSYPATLAKLAAALDVTISQLMGEQSPDFRSHWLALHVTSLDQAADTVAEIIDLLTGSEEAWKQLSRPEQRRRLHYIRRYADILDHALKDAAEDARKAFEIETGRKLD